MKKSRRVQVPPRSFTRKGNSSQFKDGCSRSKLLTMSLQILSISLLLYADQPKRWT
ncbi:unnamed protein product [Brassica rapa subsp. trilocularis]